MKPGNPSYRPVGVEGRETSWRKDDTRLHVDAFPSNPMHGRRLLRVFHNLNPHGQPRSWRVGEPFEDFARRFLPAIPRPLPGSAALLHALHITKSRRSAYDHYMLQLHDRVKADAAYQRDAPQQAIDFAPGTTWVVYSDQVLHAAMGGQFMMEQTFYLEPTDLQTPASAPLAVLQRLLDRPLAVARRSGPGRSPLPAAPGRRTARATRASASSRTSAPASRSASSRCRWRWPSPSPRASSPSRA